MTKNIVKHFNSKTIITMTAVVLMSLIGRVQAEVVISEFMANNDKTLVDGNGLYSDWIELYNTGSNSVNLTGWYLSDTTNNLTQWTFPSKSIAAGKFLVVFASGNKTAGYTDALGYLHTNFKLSASGESVVLTKSNGVTVAHAFVNYPIQDDDISYGLAQDSSFSYLIAEGESAKALIPTAEPASTWKNIGYTDTSWLSGNTGVGYDKGSTYGSMISLSVSALYPGKSTCYIRIPFQVDDPNAFSLLTLRMKYDDGFVAYINGTNVASANVPTSPTYTSKANSAHLGTTYEDFTLTNPSAYLQAGQNILAIHALDVASGTADLFIMPVLNAVGGGAIQTNSVVYLNSPTPGAANVSGVLGYVGDTSFSVDRGFFTAATNVAISCKSAGASIYYTIDGTTPTTGNGTLYTAPITISKTTVLRAAAFVTGYQPSDVDTQTYLFLADIIAQGTTVSGLAPYFPSSAVNSQGFDYGMDPDIVTSATYSNQLAGALKAIPSLSIVTDPGNLFNATTGIYVNASQEGEAWERKMSVELLNPDGTKGFQINGGMRIRGESSSSSGNPKHSFRFIFDSEYGSSRLNYKLFGDEGVDSFKRMDLRTGQNFSWANQNPAYATWLYDIFTRDTHRAMNQPYTRGRYYHLYINGMYWGLYQTEERCESRYAESYYGGDKDNFDAVKADGTTGIMYAVDGTRTAYEDLWTGMTAGVTANSAYFALQGMNADGTENSSGTKLLDVDNIIDYMMLVYFTGNRDSPIGPPNQNTMPRNVTSVYDRTNPDGFKFVAHDNEHTLEYDQGVNHNRFNQTLGTVFNGIDKMTPWWMHLKLMNNAEYKLRFADHVHKYFFNNGALTATNTRARLAARADEIYAAVVAESARWGDSQSTTPRTRDGDWLTTVNWLLDTYMPQRTSIVYRQIVTKGWYPTVAAPEFNQHGGSIASGFALSISGTTTIYYTTDGSDPRAVGGAVSGTAYSTALPLTRSTLVKARTLSGTTWSALTEAEFIVNAASPLRVTEIMYHPAEAGSGAEAGYDTEALEFIELLNTGTSAIGLVGTEFTEGIVFNFSEGDVLSLAPGEYVVVVSDIDAFSARYTNAANIKIAGEYHGKFFIPDGSLDNAGEELVLKDGLGNIIQSFEYKDSWYDITDGEGFSLTLLDPTAATNTWSVSTSWRPSAYSGGTPGYGPYDFPLPGDLIINEVLTHQDQDNPGDWVEIFNNSSTAVNLNGWFLSDDSDNLAKVALSGLALLAPGGYLVLTEATHFGTTAAGTNGFALSELGETVYLSSGSSGVLTGYRTEQEFDAAASNVTFGRHVKSDGSADFTAQSAQTPGAVNAYPLMGSVIVSEVMYHPADSNSFEFIEICNVTSANVTLYDPAYPANTWKIKGAVSYTFPMGLTLAPGECIVITETTPAAFATKYTVPSGTTVLGPYDGKLNNAGENIKLTRPGDPEVLTGEVPDILVELVDYTDAAPWPTAADGGGSSLERMDATLYPNEPTNWSANATPSPGSTGFTVVSADSDEDGMPDEWEILYFGSISAVNGGPDEDWDHDGATNYNEWYAGTIPTDIDSVFKFTRVQLNTSDSVLSWKSVAGKYYSLWHSTNLLTGEFTLYATPLIATPPVNVYTTGVNAVDCGFYKLTVGE